MYGVIQPLVKKLCLLELTYNFYLIIVYFRWLLESFKMTIKRSGLLLK